MASLSTAKYTAYGTIEAHMPVWTADDAIGATIARSSVDVERTR